MQLLQEKSTKQKKERELQLGIIATRSEPRNTKVKKEKYGCSTIEYNATQTIAIRPSYVCTQPRTECPIPLQWTSNHTSIHPTPRLMIITMHDFWESVMTRLTWSVTECPSMTFFRQTISPHHPKYQICHLKNKIQNTKYCKTRLTSGWLSAPRRLWGFQAALWSIAGLLAETKMWNRFFNLIYSSSTIELIKSD